MRVVVVGGGLAGLFTATELVSSGLDELTVVDRADQPGGVARTIYANPGFETSPVLPDRLGFSEKSPYLSSKARETLSQVGRPESDGFQLEPAVGAFTLPHPHLSTLLDRIGVEMEPVDPAATVRQVYVGGRLHEISPSPKAALAPIIPWKAKLRALVEPLVPARASETESLADFCRRRFGSRAGSMISWLMASGVFAGDPEHLSARAAFPMLTELERSSGSVIRGAVARRKGRDPDAPLARVHYPAGGMTRLSETAADNLGELYRSGFEVESVRREGDRWVVSGTETLHADVVVLATGPDVSARFVEDDLSEHLTKLERAPVIVVGVGGTGDVLPKGFGALVGPDEGMVTRGLLYESSYAPHRAPDGSWLLKMIVGGAPWSSRLSGDVVGVALKEAEIILGRSFEPSFTMAVEPLAGIPQYNVGHLRWLNRLEGLLADRPGLYVTGWGYRGVGATHLATDAVRLRSLILPY